MIYSMSWVLPSVMNTLRCFCIYYTCLGGNSRGHVIKPLGSLLSPIYRVIQKRSCNSKRARKIVSLIPCFSNSARKLLPTGSIGIVFKPVRLLVELVKNKLKWSPLFPMAIGQKMLEGYCFYSYLLMCRGHFELKKESALESLLQLVVFLFFCYSFLIVLCTWIHNLILR